MNSKQAKAQIDINEYLINNGYIPVKQKGKNTWYLSPFRKEKKASFVVDNSKKTFIDWGTGERGTIIDLVVLLNKTDISGALSLLSKYKPVKIDKNLFSFKKQNYIDTINDISGKIERINNKYLKWYLTKRKIKREIWESCNYLFQYRYVNKTNKKTPYFYNIAWKNDSGGYELSNFHFKSCLLKKDITTIQGNKDTLNIFEGFFDYLSALSFYNTKRLKNTTIVLNSVVLIEKIIPVLREYKLINSFLDNDKAGENGFLLIKSHNQNVIDRSKEIYPDFKDFNDFLINKH